VRLVDVDEAVLAMLVAAAVSGADPDEVTPPFAPDGGWGPGRVEWLRRFHRDRRAGVDGPLGEATWAVVLGEAVAGAVRLRRLVDPAVVETGIWLVRDVRGRGVGRRALDAVLARARAAGARHVRADTSAHNAAALAVLRALGFRAERAGERVVAVLDLGQPSRRGSQASTS
jgi:RimJ/RimL family protein N-acetyltransferase